VYLVPDQVYPLSPIAAMAEQDQELNAHAAAAARRRPRPRTSCWSTPTSPRSPADRVGADERRVSVKGLNGQNVLPVSLGGTTQQRIEYLNLLLQRTDRNSGQSEAARGKAQGVTATEARSPARPATCGRVHPLEVSPDAREGRARRASGGTGSTTRPWWRR
jgi:hypothetical protein